MTSHEKAFELGPPDRVARFARRGELIDQKCDIGTLGEVL